MIELIIYTIVAVLAIAVALYRLQYGFDDAPESADYEYLWWTMHM